MQGYSAMNGQRQRARGGRRRRRKTKAKNNNPGASIEPIMIAARRPNSPVILAGAGRPKVAASAKPRSQGDARAANGAPGAQSTGTLNSVGNSSRAASAAAPQRRTARIVQLDGRPLDERELERRKLLQRLMESEGRSQISRAAEAYLEAGFEFPEEQEVQLQLLEHFNETRARRAIEVLRGLIAREAPKKRPDRKSVV